MKTCAIPGGRLPIAPLLFALLLTLLGCGNLTAQNEALDGLIESFVQEGEEAEADWESQAELLEQWARRPLNLNTASLEQLLEFGLWTARQAEAVFAHRERYGPLLSIYELQSISAFKREELAGILPYVEVGAAALRSPEPWSRQLFGGDHQLLLRYGQNLEPRLGALSSDSSQRYPGHASRLYLRYRYQFGQRISYGFTAEKDPGEAVFGPTQPRGFDFYSAHAQARDLGRVLDLCLGDYELSLGQGLVWWSGFGAGKGASVMNVRRAGRTLRPFTSVNENRFLRGAAARLRLARADWTLYASRKALDANLNAGADTLQAEAQLSASALYADGLHRTPSELARKDALKETLAGVHVGRSERVFRWGGGLSHLRYNTAILPADRPYQRYHFSGDRMTHAHLHYAGTWRNISLFGEAAWVSAPGINDHAWHWRLGALQGLQASLHPRLDFSALFRHYGRAYHAPYAMAFAEQSTPRNEQGLFLGLQYRPADAITLQAYADYYQHPWLRFRADAPSRGRDYLLQISWQPSRHSLLYARARHELKQENAPGSEEAIDYLSPYRRSSLRLHADARPAPGWRLQTRLEGVWSSRKETDSPTRGWLLFQDLQWAPETLPLRLSARYALFDAENFDTRLYAYENDVLYAFAIPFLQDRGSRYYLLLHWRLHRHLDLYARYARTRYTSPQEIGTGPDQTEGQAATEVKAMIRLRW
jgi:hypothetical protein